MVLTERFRPGFALDFSWEPILHSGVAEKTLNEITREVRLRFTKGSEALQRENFDYAIDLFNQVLEKEPGLYECRKILRAAQFRRAGSDRGLLKKLVSTAGLPRRWPRPRWPCTKTQPRP